MRRRVIGMMLITVGVLATSHEVSLALRVQPDKALVEQESRKIEQMAADNDIDSLIEMLANGTFPSKVKATTYLKDTGDRRALTELERANRQLGEWDTRVSCEDRNGIFAIAIWKITTDDLAEQAKIDALLELLEGKGPMAPELNAYDTVIINGVSKEIPREARPNYLVGTCAEEELEKFTDSSVTVRLRKIDNRGIAAYAVWREVRDRPTEAAISRCVQIALGEGRTQQHGAIHCLTRLDHPNAILGLDLLAGVGYGEAIRALNHFASKPDVFDRLCNHLLYNPNYVVRLFAVSAVRFTEVESLRTQSLKALVTALYDPSDQVRRSAAQSLSNYIFPVNEAQILIVQEDLLLALEHPDAEVRSHIRTALTRMGWVDLERPRTEPPVIRTDIAPRAYPVGGGLARKKHMVALLEEQAKQAREDEDDTKLRETYTKLMILDPGNEAYRSHLSHKTPRFAMYYAKAREHDNRVGLEEIELDYLLLTEEHIVSYEWDTHTIVLTKEGVQRIPASSLIGVRGRSFVFVADGQRCYLGAFWSSFSSISCPAPVINVLRADTSLKAGRIQIERAYPTAKFSQGADPRFDDRIKKVLQETGKLTYSRSEAGSSNLAARLSEEEVLRMADEFVAKRRAKYETFDLKFYPNRSAQYNAGRRNWFIHYKREPNRWPGDHFSVYVDDTTGELKFIGGA